MKEKNVSTEKTTLKNANVFKIVNELSENSSLISKSAQCKLTGTFAVSMSDLDEAKVFTGKVTGYALIVNTFNVRTAKKSLSDVKFLEVKTDEQLYANNLPETCYRVRWTVQMGNDSYGSCTAMRGSDGVKIGADVKVTLSKSSFNNTTFVKSVINKIVTL